MHTFWGLCSFMVPSQGEAEDLLWMKPLSPTKALTSAEAVLIEIYINCLRDPHTFLSSPCSSLTTKNFHCCRTERAHLTSPQRTVTLKQWGRLCGLPSCSPTPGAWVGGRKVIHHNRAGQKQVKGKVFLSGTRKKKGKAGDNQFSFAISCAVRVWRGLISGLDHFENVKVMITKISAATI